MASAATARVTVKKSVLLVEDEPSIRNSLDMELKQYGFQTHTAKSISQAEDIIRNSKHPYDVAVLDIKLDERQFITQTGFDIGQVIREAQPELPPEIVIYSRNEDFEHYQAALKLGVAEYIKKGMPEANNIVTRIGTWALRRSVSPVRTEIGEKIEQIAEEDWDTITSVKHLCSEVIKPEVEACLGVQPIFLLSDARGTQNVILENGLHTDYDAVYKRIQDATFKRNGDGPLTLDSAVLSELAGSASPEFREILAGSSFLPLHREGDLRLSMGILAPKETDGFVEERNPLTLARMLKTRFRPPVIKLLKYLARVEAAVQNVERRTLLDHTSRFCIYVGQTQMDALEDAVESKEIETSNKCFQRMYKLSRDLTATGNELSHILNESMNKPRVTDEKKVSARSVVQKARKMIEEQQLAAQLKIYEIGDDFKLPVPERDLLAAVLRLFQWMAQREDKLPVDVPKPTIDVKYLKQNGRFEIHICDHSRRLGPQLRKRLFDPFTQGAQIMPTLAGSRQELNSEELSGLYLPLYLAKTIVQVKHNGTLEDKTDDLPSKYGHCFAIGFPNGTQTA